MPVTCSICGEEGVARPNVAAREWFGAELVHIDPQICRDNLKMKEQKRLQEEANKSKFKLSI